MDIAVRGILLFVFVFVVLRVVGRRELSSLEPFDLVLLVVLGDAIQQGLTQQDYSVTGAMIAVTTLAAMAVLVSYVGYRFTSLRRVLDGLPIVLVQDGKLIDANLRRERLTPADVFEAARLAQIGRLDDVEWAILEVSGQISFVEKA
jgi:uncharacterized membrane protein YcaP (DUF421 family)